MANIKNVRFDQFIGIFDTDYDTRPLIEYWKYQDKCGATFQRYGVFGKPERKKEANINSGNIKPITKFESILKNNYIKLFIYLSVFWGL